MANARRRSIVYKVSRRSGADQQQVAADFELAFNASKERGDAEPEKVAALALIDKYKVDNLRAGYLPPDAGMALTTQLMSTEGDETSTAITVRPEEGAAMRELPTETSLASEVYAPKQQTRSVAAMLAFTPHTACQYLAEFGFNHELIGWLARTPSRQWDATGSPVPAAIAALSEVLSETGKIAWAAYAAGYNRRLSDADMLSVSVAKMVGRFFHEQFKLNTKVLSGVAVRQIVGRLHDAVALQKDAVIAGEQVARHFRNARLSDVQCSDFSAVINAAPDAEYADGFSMVCSATFRGKMNRRRADEGWVSPDFGLITMLEPHGNLPKCSVQLEKSSQLSGEMSTGYYLGRIHVGIDLNGTAFSKDMPLRRLVDTVLLPMIFSRGA